MAQKKKILVIDDDSAVIEYLVTKLGASYEVVSTMTPRDALQLALDHKPDLILCDIDMPEVDGGDLSVEFFEDKTTRKIPFVFLTAIASQKDLGQRGGHLGGRKAISKDLPAEELLGRVRDLLGA